MFGYSQVKQKGCISPRCYGLRPADEWQPCAPRPFFCVILCFSVVSKIYMQSFFCGLFFRVFGVFCGF